MDAEDPADSRPEGAVARAGAATPELLEILFVGESWQGSSARSLREALRDITGIRVADIALDAYLPIYRGLAARALNRLLRPLQTIELETAIRYAITATAPDVVVVYKGACISGQFIQTLRRAGTPVVNVFPDCSPHAFGHILREAMGRYDLVISTKPFHPPAWQSVYGYSNPCVFVPHGYDPAVHARDRPPGATRFDVGLCCSWRPEYQRLMTALAAKLAGSNVSVAIAGAGWPERRMLLPASWQTFGERMGVAYADFLRQAKIAIAPVNREITIDGIAGPGDVDSTRTYELAAAWCFFLHQRTPYLPSVYDEQTEAPAWSDAAELAQLILRWLHDEAGRREFAARAHARAVPAYSIPNRAVAVVRHIDELLRRRVAARKNA